MTSLFPERIETDRLVLEQLCHEKVDLFENYRHLSECEEDIEEVLEYIAGFDPHQTPKETKDFIDDAEDSWDKDEMAWYVIRPKETEDGAGEIAGGALLEVDWDQRAGTLGIWLRKPFWGRGYAGERASALLDVTFNRLDLEIAKITCEIDNEKSRKAIEKYVEAYGGQYDGVLRHYAVDTDGNPIDYHNYSILREQYLASVEQGSE